VHPVDPRAREIRQRREVRLAGQPLGLEAAHLAARGGQPVHALAADHGAHGRITREPRGVIHVLVTGEPAIDRLPQQAEQPVADVGSAPAFGQTRHPDRGQVESVVQLAVGEEAAVRGDLGAVELQLEPAVERDPQRGSFGFTRRVRHPAPTRSLLHC